jgi:hypothetical protein
MYSYIPVNPIHATNICFPDRNLLTFITFQCQSSKNGIYITSHYFTLKHKRFNFILLKYHFLTLIVKTYSFYSQTTLLTFEEMNMDFSIMISCPVHCQLDTHCLYDAFCQDRFTQIKE